ncbi:MAG: GNAT family N-acetyltransferase [Alicyclobacillus sp.]|nr:GNAT family N-acetyltransferase [Alicyclobacillus sp.]
MSQGQIRPMLERDAAAVASLMLGHSLWQQYELGMEEQRNRLLRMIKEKSAFVYTELLPSELPHAAGVTETIQGFIVFDTLTFGHSGYIQLLGVRRGETGRGIGDRLVRWAHKCMLETTHRSFLLCTATNFQAQRFYQRVGYQKVGELPDWLKPGVTEYIFCNYDIREHLD